MIDELGLSLTSRILLDSSGVDYIAFTVIIMGLLSLLRDYQIRKMQHAGNAHYVALLKPFTTIVKVLVVTIIALFWAKQAGYDMSTILAGLGVGSLAVCTGCAKNPGECYRRNHAVYGTASERRRLLPVWQC